METWNFYCLAGLYEPAIAKEKLRSKAEASLHEMLTTSEYAPHGNPVAGSTARHQQHSEVERVEESNADDTRHTVLCIS